MISHHRELTVKHVVEGPGNHEAILTNLVGIIAFEVSGENTFCV